MLDSHHYSNEFIQNYWMDLLEKPRGMIINGHHYIDGDKDDRRVPNSLNGFSGREFKIRNLETGEVFITHNLWHQGQIPQAFLTPDTHSFIR